MGKAVAISLAVAVREWRSAASPEPLAASVFAGRKVRLEKAPFRLWPFLLDAFFDGIDRIDQGNIGILRLHSGLHCNHQLLSPLQRDQMNDVFDFRPRLDMRLDRGMA